MLQSEGVQNPLGGQDYHQIASDRMDELQKKVDTILEKMDAIKTDFGASSRSNTEGQKEVKKTGGGRFTLIDIFN